MKRILLLGFVALLGNFYSQSSCSNLDFEDGNFNNWILTMGSACGTSSTCYTNPAIGTNSGDALSLRRHVIFDSIGYDIEAPLVEVLCPFTNSMSVRLGNESPGQGAEEMFRQYHLGATDSVLKFHYAYVSNESSGHGGNNNPFFLVEVLDSIGNSFVPAIKFRMESTDTILDTTAGGYVRYKDWTTHDLDVSAVKGREVRIRVLNSDCNYSGHAGRVYFDFECAINTTGIENSLEDNSFNVYPNPANDKLNMVVKESGTIETFSVTGKLIEKRNVTQGQLSINTSNYLNGIYFLKYSSVNGDVKIQKIQIQK